MRIAGWLAAALLGVLLSACGGATGKASTDIKVSMTEFMFQPSQFVVPAGKEINLEATNNGAIVHNFIIMKLGTQASLPFDANDEPNVYWRVALNPGESTKMTFSSPSEAGDYQVLCSTPGHAEAGMIGNLTVVDTGP